MTFLLMEVQVPGGRIWNLIRAEDGNASVIGVIYDEHLAARIRHLLNREGLVDPDLAIHDRTT